MRRAETAPAPTIPLQQAMTLAMAVQNSGHRSAATTPARRSKQSRGTSCTLSRLATEPGCSPSASRLGHALRPRRRCASLRTSAGTGPS